MSQNIRVNTGRDKASTSTRRSCISVMATMAPQSAFYQAHPTVKASIDSTIKAGTELAAANDAVRAAVSTLRNARKTFASKLITFDNAYNVCVAQVEQHATVPEDVTGVALAVLDRQSHELAPPLGIDLRFDIVKGLVRVHVRLPPGVQGCLTEMTTTPEDPGSYKRLPGTGTRRALAGYTPGTYWFRASSLRANEESAPIAPVSVFVK